MRKGSFSVSRISRSSMDFRLIIWLSAGQEIERAIALNDEAIDAAGFHRFGQRLAARGAPFPCPGGIAAQHRSHVARHFHPERVLRLRCRRDLLATSGERAVP